MKDYVHARLGVQEAKWLRSLRAITGETDSALVKRGLRRLYDEEAAVARSALALCGASAGKFRSALTDLSDNPERLEGYGR